MVKKLLILWYIRVTMAAEKISHILDEIKQLNPAEKGELFRLFLVEEKKNMKGSRKELFGTARIGKELSEEEIKSCLYNPDINDLLK